MKRILFVGPNMPYAEHKKRELFLLIPASRIREHRFNSITLDNHYIEFVSDAQYDYITVLSRWDFVTDQISEVLNKIL